MQVAFIPPFDALKAFTKQSWYLNLPHLMTYSRYQSHFNEVYQHHRSHVIMDNGAAESQPQPISTLIEMARRKNPGELALPDVLGDAKATFALAQNFFKSWFPHPPYTENTTRLGYVVQGTTGPQAFDEFAHFMATDEGRFIEVAYLPRLLVYSANEDSGPFERIWLADEIHEHWPDLQIHLFGAASVFPEEVLIASRMPHIRSIDTSLPWQLALKGEKLTVKTRHREVSRTPDYFTRTWSPRELRLAEDNADLYWDWAHA